MTPRAWRHQPWAVEARWTRRLVRRLAEHPAPMAFRCRCGSVVVHLDTYPERLGKWRATYVSDTGEPAGHLVADDFPGALDRAREYGARLFEVL